jgi:hypothetical protein
MGRNHDDNPAPEFGPGLDLDAVAAALLSRRRPWGLELINHSPEVTAPGNLLTSFHLEATSDHDVRQRAEDLLGAALRDTAGVEGFEVRVERIYEPD